jgi:hypothetical protein
MSKIAIIKPLSKKQLAKIGNNEHRNRLSKHRAIIILAKELGYYIVEEIKTGLSYPAEAESIMPVWRANQKQLAELV